jgi:hypothetical protein
MRPEQEDARDAASTRREAVGSLSPKELAAIQAVLQANREKNFVQRITNASDWPVIQNPDGSYSSHRMGSAEVGGRNIAFPTLVYDPSTNALRAPADPVAEAIRSREYIEFPTPAAAERFASGGYKAGLNTGLMPQMRVAQANPADKAMKRILGR